MGADAPTEVQGTQAWGRGAAVSPMIAELQDVGKREQAFRVGVQVAPPFHDIGMQVGDTVDDRHEHGS